MKDFFLKEWFLKTLTSLDGILLVVVSIALFLAYGIKFFYRLMLLLKALRIR